MREREIAVTLGGAVAALTLFSISATAEPFFITDTSGRTASRTASCSPRGPSAWPPVQPGWRTASDGHGWLPALSPPSCSKARHRRRRRCPPVVWAALIGFSLGGVAHGVKNVLLRTLIHERVPDALRGRAFAAYNGARNGAELGALVLGGVVVGALGARTALLVAGLGPAVIGATCLLLLPTAAALGRRSTTKPKGEFSMHVSRDELEPTVIGEYEGRQVDAGEMRIAFESMPARFPPDESPFKGLPDDRCQCDHWGYLFKGSFRVMYLDGSEEIVTPARPTTCGRGTSSRRSSRSS